MDLSMRGPGFLTAARFIFGQTERTYGRKQLCLFPVSDTDTTGIRNPVSRRAVFTIFIRAAENLLYQQYKQKSELPPKKGGVKVLDLLLIHFLPEKDFKLKRNNAPGYRETIHFSASFSPMGNTYVFTQKRDRFYLALTDTAGKVQKILYPNLIQIQNRFHLYTASTGHLTAKVLHSVILRKKL